VTKIHFADGTEQWGVLRHHLIMRNTQCIFLSSWSHALLPSLHISTQFMWFLTHSCRAIISSHPLSMLLLGNHSFAAIPFKCIESSTFVPLVNLVMYLEARFKRLWRCTWRPTSSECRDALLRRNRARSEFVLVRTWRP